MNLDILQELATGTATNDQYAGAIILALVAVGFLWIGVTGERRRKRGER